MMANAQKMIEERKRALNAFRADENPPVRNVSFVREEGMRGSLLSGVTCGMPSLIQRGDPDKARKIAQLQVNIVFMKTLCNDFFYFINYL